MRLRTGADGWRISPASSEDDHDDERDDDPEVWRADGRPPDVGRELELRPEGVSPLRG